MERILGLIFQRIIVNTLGLYSRFYFYKLIGKNKSIIYLSGRNIDEDGADAISQQFLNKLVGLILFCLVSFSIISVINFLFYK